MFAVSLTTGAERFQDVGRVWLFDTRSDGGSKPMDLESVWEHRGGLVFKFRGVDSISEAEPLQRSEVRLPGEARVPLPEGEYYQSDLVGCEVIEAGSGEPLGTVAAFQEYGGPALLEVSRPGEPLLIPFVRSICRQVDIAGRRILVDLPDGLKELNSR